MSPRVAPAAAAAAGVLISATCVVAAVAAGEPGALVPVALPVVWWLAGLAALTARPDHASARLLTGFGLLHLAAFAASAVVGAVDRPGWGSWVTVLAASLAYDVGFAVLAVLLATFPAERLRTSPFTVAAPAVAAVVAIAAALTGPSLELPVAVGLEAVPAPRPLPVGPVVDLSPILPLLVLLALVLLLRRTLAATGDTRRQLLWPATVTAVLALLLLATPAATHLVGRWWALVFIPIVAALPVALLAGLRRFRLLRVELYAARTIGYTGVLAVVVCAYSLAAALAGGHSVLAAVVVAVAAAFTGQPLRRRLEDRVDRIASGGRLRGHAVLRHLAESLAVAEPQQVLDRAAEAVEQSLDVSWVVVRKPPALATAGSRPDGAAPDVAVPLVAVGAEVGSIECGPRRGGWSADDVALLELLGRHTGLAAYGADLTAELAGRVAELTASRERLVRAEDDARRRIERDLHDGIQQQLVVLLGKLGMLRSRLDQPGPAGLAEQAHELARAALEELRQLVRGIHPALLTDRGLVAAVEAHADLLDLPVVLDVDPRLAGQRFAVDVETAAYYVVCEAVTNVLKHSGAPRARVVLSLPVPDRLQVAVVDEGTGFAPGVPATGSGLRGLRDRVEAVGGVLEVTSTEGVGTTVVARFPAGVVAGV